MKHLIACVAGAALLAPVAGSAQSIQSRVAAAPADATVRFTFDAQPGVCGDGERISVRRGGRDAVNVTVRGREYRGDHWLRDCVEGPVELEIVRSGGRVVNAHARVGGPAGTGGIDLGRVAPDDAVAFLLSPDVLRSADERGADRMVFAATLAAAESWPGLLRVARARELDPSPRKAAVFWLSQAAGDRATEGLTSIAGDDADELEVRKQAVFALSLIRTDATIDALIEIARTNGEPEIRKNAIFWLGQSGSQRALAFFEEVLRG